MDLKAYYRKIREVEESISEAYVVVVSRETPDGGKAGVANEVTRRMAATLLVEGRVGLATSEQTREFRELAQAKLEKAAEAEAARHVKVTVVPESQLRPAKSERRSRNPRQESE